MFLKIASFNAKSFTGRSKAVRLLPGPLSFGVDVTVIQENTLCEFYARVLFGDYVVYSAYGEKPARGVSLLVKPTLGARVDFVYVDDVPHSKSFPSAERWGSTLEISTQPHV